MKTRIVCSKEYVRKLMPEIGKNQFNDVWGDILRKGKNFYVCYKKYIDAIMSSIPQYTGFDWQLVNEDIYLASMKGPSRSNPLTIKVKEDAEYMLTVLIHELTHINMPNSALTLEERAYEDVVNQVTERVCQKIGISSGLETIKLYKESLEAEGLRFTKLPIDELTVKQYYKDKKSF